MGTNCNHRFGLGGKVAVVTGGTGFLGSIFCKSLAEAGAKVVIADLKQDECEYLATQIRTEFGATAEAFAVDLASEDSVRKWTRGILDSIGSVDVLVNNAAARSPNFFSPLECFPLGDWNQVMAVNATGMFLTVRELGSTMAARGKGSIINVSSIYGVVGPDHRIYEGSCCEETGKPFNTPLVYSASKGAIIAMTKYLAAYWGPKGVRTNTLSPGGIFRKHSDVFREKYSARVPLGRMAESEEMIGALLFLASDASLYVNGQNIVVDGGLTAW